MGGVLRIKVSNWSCMRNVGWNLVLIPILLFLVNQVNGQYYTYINRGYTEAHLGVVRPMFDFGKKKGTQLARHANVGINMGGSASYYYSRQVAIEFNLNYNRNGINKQGVADAYLNLDTLNYLSAKAETGSFQHIMGATGLRFDLAPNEYFSFVFKMMGGIGMIYKPEGTITLTTTSGDQKFTETSNLQMVFTLYSSMGTRIMISEDLDVHLDVAYSGSKVDFAYRRNGIDIIENEHIGYLMIQAGVGYAF